MPKQQSTSWNLVRLSSLGDGIRPAIKAGPFGSALKKEFYVSEGYKVYGQEQVVRDEPSYGNYYVDEERYNSLRSCEVRPGDLLLSLVGTTGKVMVVPNGAEPGIINPRLLRLSFDRSRVNPRFMKHLFQSPLISRELSRRSQGGTMGVLNAGSVGELMVPLPGLGEQEALDEILSTWDEAIKLQDQLVASIATKHGALISSFVFGRLRLPGWGNQQYHRSALPVEVPRDWSILKIAEVAREVSERNATEASVPVLTCTKYEGFVESLKYFDRRVFSEDTSNYKVICHNDIGFPSNHVEEGSIGLQNLVPAGLVSPIYTVFRPNQSKVDPRYLIKVLKTESYRQIFEARTNASVDRRGSLRWSEFSQVYIPVPSLPEQKSIADLLEDFEQESRILAAQRELLAKQRAGLMQKLLTGSLRVPLP